MNERDNNTIGYLGPKHSHSHQAVLKLGLNAEATPYPFLEKLLDAIGNNKITYAVVPIENALEGGVSNVMSILGSGQYPITILAEFNIPIEHTLLAKDVSEITTIISHPQALAQCQTTIKESLGDQIKFQQASSTSDAARLVAESNETGIAALATQLAGEANGLKVITKNASDSPDNQTRFLLLTHDEQREELIMPDWQDKPVKTSLCLGLKDRPGVLVDCLLVFKAYGANLTRIESRPSRKKLGDYLFYLDMDCDLNQEQYKAIRLYLDAETTHLVSHGPYASLGLL